MRPSNNLITYVLVLTVITVVVGFWLSGFFWFLLILWGGLLAAIFADLMFSVPPKRLKIDAHLPALGFVGQKIDLLATIIAQKGSLPKGLAMRLDLPISFMSEPEFSCQDVDAASNQRHKPKSDTHRLKAPITKVVIDASLVPTKRGQFKISHLWLKWTSKFSLLEFVVAVPLHKSIDVVPDISPILSNAINTQIYPLADGQKEMKNRGDGSEFHQLREFATGMDPRNIDWKRSARMRSLIVRETRVERNHHIVLCIDSGRLMAEQLAGLSKLDRAINSALAMCWASGIAGDNVSFYSFDSKPRIFLPAMPGRQAFKRMQTICAQMQYEAQETNHTLGLTQLATKLKKRSLVIIFSDFVDTITAQLMIENMQMLTRQHLIMYVALKDPILDKLTQPKTLGLDAIARAVSAYNLIEERCAVLEKLDRLGVLCLDSTPEKLTTDLISRYIDVKLRGMI